MFDQTILQFVKPGMLTTVQDLGRHGYQQYGVPVGGPMDMLSARSANWLVGNPENSPVLEITLMGPEIDFHGNCQIAITGAHISPKINGCLLTMNQTVNVKKGDQLKFGKLELGCRAYLAIGGKWKVDSWLNSVCAASYEKELTPNNIIHKDGQLLISDITYTTSRILPQQFEPKFDSEAFVKVLPGPDFDHFSKRAKNFFFSQKFKISGDSNRMGYRLSPNIDSYVSNGELISSGIIPGTIQVTNSGQPIVLTADAQTVGGYFRIGNVIASDLDKIGQLRPGDHIQFELISLDEAITLLKESSGLLELFQNDSGR